MAHAEYFWLIKYQLFYHWDTVFIFIFKNMSVCIVYFILSVLVILDKVKLNENEMLKLVFVLMLKSFFLKEKIK